MARILIHYGELTLKGRNRRNFERKLAANLKAQVGAERIERQHGRMLAELPAADAASLEQLALIPGIRNFAVVHTAGPELADMRRVAEAAVREDCGEVAGKRFRVTARRSDKSFPLGSLEIAVELGDHLRRTLAMTVDLEHPEITVHVECTKAGVYIYTDKRQGIGGLPVGTSGRGVVLFSGGIDSPVAAYIMMKRGMQVTLAHFYNSSLNRDFAKIRELARVLSRYQGRLALVLVDLDEFQRHTIATVPPEYRMIIYKRQMLRQASRIAEHEQAQALVTGDSLGQVASQTLANIHAIYDVAELPLLPPLIGMDKEEIITLARRIGTFEPSIEEYCDICSFLVAKHPETHARREQVARYEAMLPIATLAAPERRELYFAGKQREVGHE
jgi:thiamine biosynthesis protein ThiI